MRVNDGLFRDYIESGKIFIGREEWFMKKELYFFYVDKDIYCVWNSILKMKDVYKIILKLKVI